MYVSPSNLLIFQIRSNSITDLFPHAKNNRPSLPFVLWSVTLHLQLPESPQVSLKPNKAGNTLHQNINESSLFPPHKFKYHNLFSNSIAQRERVR